MKTKKAIVYLIAFLMIVGLFGGFKAKDVYAEDVSIIISIEPMTIHVGDTVTATVTVSGDAITSFQIYLNYTSSVLEYQSSAGSNGSIGISGTGATTISYNFKAIAEGNASFTTTGQEIYGENNAVLSVSHAGAVFSILGEGEEEKEAESDSEETEEEEDDGTIKVAGEKYTLTYKDYFPAVPADYTLSYVTYKGEDIYAYQAPTTGIKIVSLTNSDYESKWFVFNEDDETFSPYIDYELVGIKYTIIEKPSDVELPAGFNESLLTLNDTTFVAYTDGTESGLYLVYAVNQYGMSDFYYYDTDEGSLTKYDTIKKLVDAEVSSATNAMEKAAEEEAEAEEKESVQESESSTESSSFLLPQKNDKDDEDGLSKDMLKRIIKTFIIVFIILCILMIILVIRNSNLQNKLLDYEDEEDEKAESEKKNAPKEGQDPDTPMTAEERAAKTAREKIEAEKLEAEKAEKKKISRNKGYAVGEETGEIQIEEAQDNNAGVNVPPASDKGSSKIEDAMKERPFGIDSAFDVVTMDDAPEGDHVLIESEENLVPAAGSETVNSETVQKVWTEKNEELKLAEEEMEEISDSAFAEQEESGAEAEAAQEETAAEAEEAQEEIDTAEAETEVLTASMLEPANNVMNKISEIRSRDKKQAAPEKEPEKIVLPNFDEEEE